MEINPAILSSASALLGALAGGSASLGAAVYTQRYQDRLQRNAREISKREDLYAEFIMAASALIVSATFEDGLVVGRSHQELVGMLNRMKLFAPEPVLEEAERVISEIVAIASQPRLIPADVTASDVARIREVDAVAVFSKTCRDDLDRLLNRL